MISLLFAIVLGIGFTLLALQNPQLISVNLYSNVFTLPVYFFAAVLFLLGITVGFIFHLFDIASKTVDINNKNQRIKESAADNLRLRDHIQKLTLENANLREQLDSTHTNVREEKINSIKEHIGNFFGRLRQNFVTYR